MRNLPSLSIHATLASPSGKVDALIRCLPSLSFHVTAAFPLAIVNAWIRCFSSLSLHKKLYHSRTQHPWQASPSNSAE